MTGLYWRDGDGLVHIVIFGVFVTACTRQYRLPNVREPDLVPTCLDCIAKEGTWTA